VGLVLAVAFALQIPLVTQFWPWPTGYFSNLFIGSIIAAVAAPILWIGWTGEWAAIPGGAINIGLMSAGAAVLAFQTYAADNSRTGILAFGIMSVVALIVSLALLAVTWRRPFKDERPIPRAVLWAFGAFIALLLIAGTLLVLQRPNTFPWPIPGEVSVLYGLIFLGASTYFMYALARRKWGNAEGQLLGFLAYDLVLIGPFVLHFATVRPEMLVSLIVYVTGITLSGLLAIYFLFVNPETRLWTPNRQSREAGAAA
jgi:hypothetical protein